MQPKRIRPWSLGADEIAGRYRVFDVVKNRVRDASGAERGDVFSFACPDWCNVVAVTPEDAIVLVWQWRFGTRRFELETPGGVIETGEAPEAAARRELAEETGYAAASFASLGAVSPNPALQGNACHSFLALGAIPTTATSFDPLEELEIELVAAKELPGLIDRGIVRHSLAVVALERYLRGRAR